MRTWQMIAKLLIAAGLGLSGAAAAQPVVAVQVEPEATASPPAPEPEAAPAPEAEAPPEAPDLDSLLWIARPVVVFADSENDPRFRQQMDMLDQYSEDLLARDVVILTDIDAGTLSDLRRELRPRDFTLVLIDKDGTVVQRRPAPTTVRELTHTIDRLPSRRLETGSMRQ